MSSVESSDSGDIEDSADSEDSECSEDPMWSEGSSCSDSEESNGLSGARTVSSVTWRAADASLKETESRFSVSGGEAGREERTAGERDEGEGLQDLLR